MKSLRILALMLAVGASSIFSMQANAQQDVDPDHFEQQSAAQANVHSSKAQNHHKAMAAHNQHRGNLKLASKHSGSKGTHHHAHASA